MSLESTKADEIALVLEEEIVSGELDELCARNPSGDPAAFLHLDVTVIDPVHDQRRCLDRR